ncbi:MAG: hypothetical protein NW201_07265 [Gemmatimonadales bacterium]|nr:hypothetical protein [Gemmatimonadales bacterium]
MRAARWVGAALVAVAALGAPGALAAQRNMALEGQVTAGPPPEDPGTVLAIASSPERNRRKAAIEAQARVVRALLFVGVPGTVVPQAMVPDEAAARAQSPGYFEQLIEGQGFAPYVVRTQELPKQVEKGTTWLVTVNYVALRTALEQRGAVRKFGF